MKNSLLSLFLFFSTIIAIGQDSTSISCGFVEDHLSTQSLEYLAQYNADLKAGKIKKTEDAEWREVRIGIIADYGLKDQYGDDLEMVLEDMMTRVAEPFEDAHIILTVSNIVIPESTEKDIFENLDTGYGFLDKLFNTYSSRQLDSLDWDIVMGMSSSFTDVGGVAGGRYNASNFSTITIAHEIGHNLGSPHTHSCFWNNGKPLSICYPVEGSCYDGPLENTGEGTLMSYCVSNYNFHPQVIDLIESYSQRVDHKLLQTPSTPSLTMQTTGISTSIHIERTSMTQLYEYEVAEDISFTQKRFVGSTKSPHLELPLNIGGKDLYIKVRSVNPEGKSGWSSPFLISYDTPEEEITLFYDKPFMNVDEKEVIDYSKVANIDFYSVRYWYNGTLRQERRANEPNFDTFAFRGRFGQPHYNKVKFQMVGYQGGIPTVASKITESVINPSSEVLDNSIGQSWNQELLSFQYPYNLGSQTRITLENLSDPSIGSQEVSISDNYIVNANNLLPNSTYKITFEHLDPEVQDIMNVAASHTFVTGSFESYTNVKTELELDGNFTSLFKSSLNTNAYLRPGRGKTKVIDFNGTIKEIDKTEFNGLITASSFVKSNNRENWTVLNRLSRRFSNDGSFPKEVYSITEVDPKDNSIIQEKVFELNGYIGSQGFDVENLNYISDGFRKIYKIQDGNAEQIWELFDPKRIARMAWGEGVMAAEVLSSSGSNELHVLNYDTDVVQVFNSSRGNIYDLFYDMIIDKPTDDIYLFNGGNNQLFKHEKAGNLTQVFIDFSPLQSGDIRLQASDQNKLYFTNQTYGSDVPSNIIVSTLDGTILKNIDIPKIDGAGRFRNFSVNNDIVILSQQNVFFKVYLNCDKPIETTPILTAEKEVYYNTDGEINITATGCENYNWTFTDFSTNENQVFLNTNQVSINNETGGVFKAACSEDECISEVKTVKEIPKYTFAFTNKHFFPPSCVGDAILYQHYLGPRVGLGEINYEYQLKNDENFITIPRANPESLEATRIPLDVPYGTYEINLVAKTDSFDLIITNPDTVNIQPNLPKFKIDYANTAILGEEVPVKIDVTNGSIFLELNGTFIQQNEPIDTTFIMNELGNFEFQIDYQQFPFCVNQERQNFNEKYVISVIALSSEQEINLSVFPNPTAESITVQLPDGQNEMEYKVFNATGVQIIKGVVTNGNSSISLARIPAGVYILRAMSDDGIQEFKVVKR